MTAELDQHPALSGIPPAFSASLLLRSRTEHGSERVTPLQTCLLHKPKNICAIFTNFSCQVYIPSLQVYIYIRDFFVLVGLFIYFRKGDPKVCFDWKVAQRGKCTPVKLRICWIMKHKGTQPLSYCTATAPFHLLDLFSSDPWLQESEQELLVTIWCSTEKNPLIFMPLCSTKSQWFCRFPSVFAQNLSDYSSSDLARPEWTHTWETKMLPCFREVALSMKW